ncbi:MAG: hypothetical protein E2O47_00685 [Gemmatimonadetes bacterium]|nr:MAG: hypothetical protein E2O47_00685 [Gemmatimonadota bacterium]
MSTARAEPARNSATPVGRRRAQSNCGAPTKKQEHRNRVVGVAELVGVVLLLVPGTALRAAGGLIVIMIGALGTVLVFRSELGWFGPTLHLGLLSAIVWLRLRLMRPSAAK